MTIKSKSKAEAAKVLAGVKAGIVPAVTLSDAEKARIIGEARTIGTKRKSLRFEAAKFVQSAFAAGYVGERGKPGSVWSTGADLMRDMEIGTSRDFSDLRILGVLSSLGVTEEHRVWTLVSANAGAAGVNAVSKAKKPTISAFEKAAKANAAKKAEAAAKKAIKGTTPRKSAAEKKAEEKEEERTASKADGSAYALVTGALAVLRENRDALSTAQARTIRASLATLLSEYGETVATPEAASGE